jgi:thiamine pyrophosphate-dependent acetolactate synthase large subunit-like protein
MTEMSAGRAVVELLKAEGVRQVFGIVGATFLDVLDVLYDDKSVAGAHRAAPARRHRDQHRAR